jgi:hypothetical protein
MTGRDVLVKALEAYEAESFPDCVYCAISDAKSALDDEVPTDLDHLPILVTILRQALTGDVEEMEFDQPLVDAREALTPFISEIADCPSPLSPERNREILRSAIQGLDA